MCIIYVILAQKAVTEDLVYLQQIKQVRSQNGHPSLIFNDKRCY